MESEFTAPEVSRLAGFEKPWMLGHLEREKTFVREKFDDRRHGRARKYTFRDLLVLRAINRMLQLGARPARVRDVIKKLSALEDFNDSREAALSLVTTLGVKLFVSKNEAYLIKSDQEVLDLSKGGQLAFGFMLDMHFVLREVAAVVDVYGKQKVGNLKVDIPVLNKLCVEAGI